MFGPPLGGDRVQAGHLLRGGPPQLEREQVPKQVVVAKPASLRIHSDHERARVLKLHQDSLRARASRQPVSERSADPLQQRGSQQQLPHFRRLALEHLRQQVVGHRALTAREADRVALGIRVAGERQCHQSQPRRPAFGCRDQRLERAVGQPHPRRLQQRARLLEREAKVLAPDLGQLPLHTQPVQPQPQIPACHQHESQLRRRGPEQHLNLADGLLGLQLVQVVDHQPQRLLERAQILQQPMDDVRAVQTRRGGQLPHPLRSGTGLAQRVQDRQPKRLRIVLLTPHRHPRHALAPDPPPRSTSATETSSRSPPAPTHAPHARAAPNSSNRPGRGTNHALTPGTACSTAAPESATTHMVAPRWRSTRPSESAERDDARSSHGRRT